MILYWFVFVGFFCIGVVDVGVRFGFYFRVVGVGCFGWFVCFFGICGC